MKNRLQILVVDDEPTVRQAIKQLLKHVGYEVEAVEGGEAALDLMQQRVFDVVITDFSMPGMYGDQLAARIRTHSPGQPIIMVTAYAQEFKVFGQPYANVDALILKPFTLQELDEAIKQVVRQPQTREPAIVMPGFTQASPLGIS
jgi:CheY-like chemotaxis protein